MTVKECERAIKPHLTERRFHHSKCVSEEAGRLAARYGADVEKAEMAGMLHDIMKDTKHGEQLKIIKRFDIILNDVEKGKPKLWHAISGAAYLEHVLGIRDPEILSAVRWHTSGHKGMTLMEKIIFIADFTSAERDYPGVEKMRRLSHKSLELAMIEGITFTVNDLFQDNALVGADMIDAYNDAVTAVYGDETERI